jgi:hypothetical protein
MGNLVSLDLGAIVSEGESFGVTIDINFSGYSKDEWLKFNFKIRTSDEEFEKLIKIGKGQGYILENPSGYEGITDISDDINQVIYNMCSNLDPDLCNPAQAYHVVIIESIELEKKYRKKGFGLETIKLLLTFFKGDLVIIVPCPIRGTCPKKDEDKVTEKLRKHWMKCGFKQMRDTNTFYSKQ